MTGRRRQGRSRESRVITFAELAAIAHRAGGEAAQRRLDDLARSLSALDNTLEKTRPLAEATIVEARFGGPAAVVGFAGLHYPPRHVDPDAVSDRLFADAIEAARLAVARRFDISVSYGEYFFGISDMSFLGRRPGGAETAFVVINTPAPDLVDHPPMEGVGEGIKGGF